MIAARLSHILRPPYPYVFVFLVCLAAYGLTTARTLHATDSAELIAAAKTLGIPHAPGYPLYTMTAHLFTKLPFADATYAVNLYSALSLALAAPFLMVCVQHFVANHAISMSVTLAVMFSFYIWTTGIAAEVYAPQLLMLSVTGASLVYLARQETPTSRHSIAVGVAFGLALAMAPASALLSLGLMLAFLLLRKLTWGQRIAGGLASLIVFGVCLLYFPLAYEAEPEINSAGIYNEDGVFEPVDLTTLDGIWWLLSGQQFENDFFEDGLIATPERIAQTGRWFAANFFSIGLVLAGAGLVILYRGYRGAFAVWLVMFAPYTYFFMTYGAGDRQTMFGPSYFLLAIPFGLGMRWATSAFSARIRNSVLICLPILFLVLTFWLIKTDDVPDAQGHSETVLSEIPENAIVFGDWADAMPLTYQKIVSDQRPDIDVYTLFFFEYDQTRVQSFIDQLLDEGQTVVFLDDSGEKLLDANRYRLTTLFFEMENDIRIDEVTVEE